MSNYMAVYPKMQTIQYTAIKFHIKVINPYFGSPANNPSSPFSS